MTAAVPFSVMRARLDEVAREALARAGQSGPYDADAAVWRPRRMEKFRRRYYLLGPDEQALAQPVPEVDTGLVIHITPQGCEAYPIVCDAPVFEAFLAVQDTARWLWQTSRTVMSDPLTPVPRKAQP